MLYSPIMKKITTIFLFLYCITPSLGALPFSYLYEEGTILYSHTPVVELGTHTIDFGLSSTLAYSTPLDSVPGSFLGFESHVALLFNQVKLGIPGSDYQYEGSIFLNMGFGGESRFPRSYYLFPGIAEHTFSYYWGYYGAGDGTQQPTGGWRYQYSGKNIHFRLTYENDWFGLLFSDQFRTAAVIFQIRHKMGPFIPGLEGGFMLWTGKKDGLSPLTRGGVYNFSGQFGGEYSHGIVFLSFMMNEFKLTLGYDSEAIRTAIQNTIHWMVNDGSIPALNREDRFYLQFGVSVEGLVY